MVKSLQNPRLWACISIGIRVSGGILQHKRIHSHCDYMSPNDYEELYRRVQQHELLMAG